MKFLRARKFGNEHLRGPSVDALKLGAKKFYGEISGGDAAGTPLLVEVEASKREIIRLNPESSDKLYLPEDLDVIGHNTRRQFWLGLIVPRLGCRLGFFVPRTRRRERMAEQSSHPLVHIG